MVNSHMNAGISYIFKLFLTFTANIRYTRGQLCLFYLSEIPSFDMFNDVL